MTVNTMIVNQAMDALIHIQADRRLATTMVYPIFRPNTDTAF
jgi:hypothetical protein